MLPMNLAIVFKFLVGIVLVQGMAGLLVYAAIQSGQARMWLLLGALALLLALLTALWFGSLAGQLSRDTVGRVREDHARQRERIRVKAEREKTAVIKQSHRQIARERNRAQNRAGIKAGASFIALAGLGAVLLLTQFATFGLLTLATAGGAIGGYVVRGRRERAGSLAPPLARWTGLRLPWPADKAPPDEASTRAKGPPDPG